MAKIITPAVTRKPPECPLCLNPMELKMVPSCADFFWRCRRPGCGIFIEVNDPLIEQWENEEKVECIHCGANMRMFCRSDGYKKCTCPQCKATYEDDPTYRGPDPGGEQDNPILEK